MKAVIQDAGEHWAASYLGTGYRLYTSPLGIKGLYLEKGDRLNLLVVDADDPGHGQFREFIKACKEVYATICIWQVSNPFLGDVLLRYGFKPEREIQGDGEMVDGYRWDKA